REHSTGPLEIGRGPRRATPRLTLEDLYVSRDHLLAEEVAPGRLRLENISRKNAVEIENETPLSTGSVRILPLPVRVQIGRSSLRFEATLLPSDANLQTVRRPFAVDSALAVPRLSDLGQAPSAEVLTQWLERIFTVQRAAAGS